MSELFFGLADNPALGLSFSGDGSTPPDPVTTPDPTDAPNPEEPAMRIDLGHVYHVSYPQMKCDENSERGIRYAHRHGWSIDLDLQKDALGNILLDHWQELMLKDGWFDPAHHLNKREKLNTLTPDTWSRLTTKHGDHLWTVEQGLHLLGQLHTKGRLEPKAGNHWTLADAQHMHDVARSAKAVVVIATLDTDQAWRERLALFRQAGFPDCRRLRG